MSNKPKSASVFQFRPRAALDPGPEIDLPMPATIGPQALNPTRGPALDLSGKPKVWFLIGRGRVGKTTLVRVAAEIAENRGGQLICAAADPLNRSLRTYREGVAEPATNDPAEVVDFLQDLLGQSMQEKFSAMIDLGGGDTSLHRLLAIMPDLADVMEAEGVAPVAVHVIGTDPHDLVPLAAMEAAGFRPAATAIVCNEMTGGRAGFAPVLRHSAVLSALSRGAVQVWLPFLSPEYARMVDARRLPFLQVGNNLGPFAGAGVRNWIRSVTRELEPIMSWLP